MGQILTDGQYHADPHPGNVLVDLHGVIWLLDFGSVGRLDPLSLEGLQGLALGFAMNDPSLLARAVSTWRAATSPPTCGRSRSTSARC